MDGAGFLVHAAQQHALAGVIGVPQDHRFQACCAFLGLQHACYACGFAYHQTESRQATLLQTVPGMFLDAILDGALESLLSPANMVVAGHVGHVCRRHAVAELFVGFRLLCGQRPVILQCHRSAVFVHPLCFDCCHHAQCAFSLSSEACSLETCRSGHITGLFDHIIAGAELITSQLYAEGVCKSIVQKEQLLTDTDTSGNLSFCSDCSAVLPHHLVGMCCLTHIMHARPWCVH